MPRLDMLFSGMTTAMAPVKALQVGVEDPAIVLPLSTWKQASLGVRVGYPDDSVEVRRLRRCRRLAMIINAKPLLITPRSAAKSNGVMAICAKLLIVFSTFSTLRNSLNLLGTIVALAALLAC